MQSTDSSKPLTDIDPGWAWEPWQPSAQEPWDERRAALLFRRAGFCASATQLKDASKLPVSKAIDQLCTESAIDRAAMDTFEAESEVLGSAVRATGDAKQLTTWWLHRMLMSPRPLLEKMTLLWHGHFATGAEKVLDLELMYQQNQLLRTHAMGDFRAMTHGISKDPAMLIYLDSVSNRKAHANENFARELMELFCLGEGNYTETDVQQLARCFTGWEIRRRQFRFNSYQHDTGIKTLFGQKVESGEAAVDLVLDHPQLPYFVVGKLFRFFVCDEPAPPRALLEPLARQFAAEKLHLAGVVRTLLHSRLLLSGWSAGRKIRSPVELAIGFLRTMEGTTNMHVLSDRLREVGQALFYPPNVKGWDGGRAWVNSSTLVGRANLIHQVVRHENTRCAGSDLDQYVKIHSDGSPEGLLDWFTKLFFALPLDERRRAQLLVAMSGKTGSQTSRELLSLLAALPQFQLA